MADQELPDLTAASLPLAGTELLYLAQGGADRRATVDDVAPTLRAEVVTARGSEASLDARLDAIEASIPAAGGAPFPEVLPNGYRTQTFTNANFTATGTASNRQDLAPVTFERDFVCDEFGGYCTGSATAGNALRFVVYDSDANGYPKDIVLQSADIEGSSSTFHATTPPGGEYVFQAGKTYWFGTHTQSSSAGNWRAVQLASLRVLGNELSSSSTNPTILRLVQTWASGPIDPWVPALGQLASSTIHAVFLHRKATP